MDFTYQNDLFCLEAGFDISVNIVWATLSDYPPANIIGHRKTTHSPVEVQE